ncbi:unnamed protein product [Ectocarpus sp. CCAP 1310/34]|nr:unnamed protein product [Ectocarpus sp. CCAP 1310/34]
MENLAVFCRVGKGRATTCRYDQTHSFGLAARKARLVTSSSRSRIWHPGNITFTTMCVQSWQGFDFAFKCCMTRTSERTINMSLLLSATLVKERKAFGRGDRSAVQEFEAPRRRGVCPYTFSCFLSSSVY